MNGSALRVASTVASAVVAVVKPVVVAVEAVVAVVTAVVVTVSAVLAAAAVAAVATTGVYEFLPISSPRLQLHGLGLQTIHFNNLKPTAAS